MATEFTVYIAGPMRGYPRFNVDAFDAAAKTWRDRGAAVISPVDGDRECGIDHDTMREDDITADMLRDFARRSLEGVGRSDAVAVLPGWERSKGTIMEVAHAQFIGLPIYDAVDARPIRVRLSAEEQPISELRRQSFAGVDA